MAATAQNRTGGHEAIELGPLKILPGEQLARVGGRALMLSIRELHLLVELGRRADRIVSREELYLVAWGRKMRPCDRSVDVYVRRLRVKLEGALPEWSFIHTHFGFGYRLAAERVPPAPGVAPPAAPPSEAGPTDLSQEADHSFTTR